MDRTKFAKAKKPDLIEFCKRNNLNTADCFPKIDYVNVIMDNEYTWKQFQDYLKNSNNAVSLKGNNNEPTVVGLKAPSNEIEENEKKQQTTGMYTNAQHASTNKSNYKSTGAKMSKRFGVRDFVSVQINDTSRIGLVEYIGSLGGRKCVGVNLVDRIENGGNGSIDGVQLFKCPMGHGVYVDPTQILKEVTPSELTQKMQEVIIIFEKRLDEYVAALSERDGYIEQLKDKVRGLENKLHALNNKHHGDHNLHTMKALAQTPPPNNKSKPGFIESEVKESAEYFEAIDKHSEYTKYKESPTQETVTSASSECTEDSGSSSSSSSDSNSEEDDDEDSERCYDDEYISQTNNNIRKHAIV